jgi:hypothetical protein
MKGPATMNWSRLLMGVFLTLLVREALAPGRAFASCGDYVTVANPSRPSGLHPMPGKPAPPSSQVPHRLPAPGESPCHTPSCSGEPALPAPPVSSGRDTGQERWDCLLTLPAFHPATAFGLSLAERVPRPRRRPSSIFHPPRPS